MSMTTSRHFRPKTMIPGIDTERRQRRRQQRFPPPTSRTWIPGRRRIITSHKPRSPSPNLSETIVSWPIPRLQRRRNNRGLDGDLEGRRKRRMAPVLPPLLVFKGFDLERGFAHLTGYHVNNHYVQHTHNGNDTRTRARTHTLSLV